MPSVTLCRVHNHSIFWPLWQDKYFKLQIIDYCTSITTSKPYKIVIPTGAHSIHSYDYCPCKLTNGGGLLCKNIVYCREYFTHLETLDLEVKDCMCKANIRHIWSLSREGSLSCHTCCDTGPPFILPHQQTPRVFPLLTHRPRGSSHYLPTDPAGLITTHPQTPRVSHYSPTDPAGLPLLTKNTIWL